MLQFHRFLHSFLGASLLCLGAFPVRGASSSAELKAGDFVAMCGDSITAQKLYTLYVENYLVLCRPQADLQAMQFGWGGEKAPSFAKRLSNDVLPFRPSVVTLCYGMNDGGYAASTPKTLSTYREALLEIVAEMKKDGVRRIILGSPGAVDTDSFKKLEPAVYNHTLQELGNVAREVAKETGVEFADVLTPMLEAMEKSKAKYGHRYFVSGGDGIHPNRNGHLVMAYAFLKALGCEGDIGTITFDARDGKAETSEGHKILSSGASFVEIESSRYPFCFSGKPSQMDGNLGMTEFIPFNEELNRFILVVKNPTGQEVKITWGDQTKAFPAEVAAKGINLAAEFLENPFSKPFAEAELKIREKQFEESPLSKVLINSLPQWKQTFPDADGTFQELSDKILQRASSLRKQTSEILVPVKHKITIETAAS